MSLPPPNLAAVVQDGNLNCTNLRGSLPALERFEGCYPEFNLVDIYRAHLARLLSELSGLDAATLFPAFQWTQTLDKGDLVLPLASLRVKDSKPDQLAAEWARKFPDSPLVDKPIASGAYLQFCFTPDKLLKLAIPHILDKDGLYGRNPTLGLRDPEDESKGRKRMVVEFSSPNIAKPFHAGHLRSTIIGGFISNLYEGGGWEVIRLNYLGDWGKQYGLLALGFEKYGDENALQADPINHLYEIYVRINKDLTAEFAEIKELEAAGKMQEVAEIKTSGLDEQARRYFKAMTMKDEHAISQWKKFRNLSIIKYKETYARLNIHFNEYLGESQVKPESIAAVAREMEESNLSEPSQGALIIDFSKHVPGKIGKGLGKALVKKSDGTSLYLTRDIGALFERDEAYDFDQMIYVVASQQDLHMRQLFKIIELTGHHKLAAKVQHISFGLVLGMSTRKGTVKFLDDILHDVGEKMHEVMRGNAAKYEQVKDPDSVADILGISSVMVQDMRGKRINNYHFNMEVMTSFEGDTGPYLQYAHARLCSIKRKAGCTPEELRSADLSLLTESHSINLIRVLARYSDVVQNTFQTHEPTTILTYLFKMTHSLSSSYDILRVVGSEPELVKARMALYQTALIVLGNGMRLLGLTPVERM